MRPFSRILAGTLSPLGFLLFGSIFGGSNIRGSVWVVALCSWLSAWAALEILAFRRRRNSPSRLLTHLRYAPMAVLVIFVAVVLAYDEAMILRSKWEIRQYVYSNQSPETAKSFDLHNNYRGWCGNGYSAAIYDLYADTAAEGFDSPDPAVRARSLRASIEVHDWLNGVSDGPFPKLIERAGNDPDPIVRKIAAEFRGEAYGVGK